MSEMFNNDEDNQNNMNLNNSTGKTYVFEDQVFSEVEVDENPPEDDESVAWTDAGDNVEEVLDDEMTGDFNVNDMAHCTFTGHKDSVYCVAVHPSQPGVIITGGGDDVGYIWKYDTFSSSDSSSELVEGGSVSQSKIVSTIELAGHTDTVTAVGFNFNGTLALTGSYDGTVKIWRVETGECIQTLEGPEDVEWAQWHSKGNAVIAGSRDGSIWMWLTQNGQCVQVFAGHDGPVSAGCFSSDGKLVCSGGEDGTVRMWLPKTGACGHVFEGPLFGHEGMITSLASNADGDLLLSGSADGSMKLYQLSGKKFLQKFLHWDPAAAAAAAAGTEATPGNVFSTMTTIPESTRGGDMDEEEEGEEGMEMQGEGAGEELLPVECVGFAKGGLKWVASGGMDKNLKVWDMTTGACRCVCAHGGSVVALKWHDTLPIVCTAALDNVIRIWDARNGSLLAELTGHTDLVTSLDLVSLKSFGGNTEAQQQQATNSTVTDVIVSVSDDGTSKVFMVDMTSLLG